MTFLPIVQRELREASRRRSTYRLRWWCAVIAMLMSCFFLFAIGLTRAPATLGNPLFGILSGYAFGLCLLAGVLLTADCLSAEKREGTLGLLFLTDLKGYDVVLGKFMARSLNAFYGLLALLPVLALPLLLGGLMWGEFWRMSLALVNALFFSLAAGICVSTFTSDSQRAMRNTFGLLLLLAAGLPVLAALGARAGFSPIWWCFAWCSPFHSFAYAPAVLYAAHRGLFWGSLAASQLLGWLFLALASHALPRRWQQAEGAFEPGWLVSRCWRQGRGDAAKRVRARANLLSLNPVLWWLNERSSLRWIAWGPVMLWGLVVLAASWRSRLEGDVLLMGAKSCGFLLKMLVALQACRFFVEARRTGALELLLCTPLRSAEILKGQRLALRRLFLWPVLAAILLGFVPFTAQAYKELATGRADWIWSALAASAGGIVIVSWFALGLVVDIVAVTWVGMWLALSAKKPALAPALTILFVLVLPSVAVCGSDIIVDLFLILWSTTRLQQDFRWVLVQQYQTTPNDLRISGSAAAPR